MPKWLKWTLISIGSIILILSSLYRYMIHQTKKHSPLIEYEYVFDDVEVSINYCSPSVKGRKIFGELVPYDVVWRTGANEPTTFSSNNDIVINGQTLPKGNYTFWTIPNEDEWQLIWNSGSYPWGVNYSGQASREADKDALIVAISANSTNSIQEKLVIEITDGNPHMLQLHWENTLVSVPIEASENY